MKAFGRRGIDEKLRVDVPGFLGGVSRGGHVVVELDSSDDSDSELAMARTREQNRREQFAAFRRILPEHDYVRREHCRDCARRYWREYKRGLYATRKRL